MTNTALAEISADQKQAITLLDHAKSIVIVTNEDRIAAEAFIQELSAAEKKRFAYLDPERTSAYENYLHHKKRLDDAINPLIEARKATKQKCISWDAEQERIRLDEQRKLEAEARKRAEEEALAIAAQAEAEGDTETAEAIISAPLDVAPIIAQKTAPAPSRLTAGRSVWSAEVINLTMLVKAVAEGKQPIALLMANQTALNNAAKLIKVHGSIAIHGCRVVEKKV